jgi:hypothetical protein
MLGRGMGVQHPALAYWRPSDPGDIETRDALYASHQPGGEPLLRFAPGQPIRLVHAATPAWSEAPRSAEADTPRRLGGGWVRAVLRMVIRAFVMLTVASLAVAAGAVVVGYAWSPDWLAAAFVLPWWRGSGAGRTDAARDGERAGASG